MKSFEAVAQEAYTAFRSSLPEQDWTLPWDGLTEATREAWRAAARKMAEEIQQVH